MLSNGSANKSTRKPFFRKKFDVSDIFMLILAMRKHTLPSYLSRL